MKLTSIISLLIISQLSFGQVSITDFGADKTGLTYSTNALRAALKYSDSSRTNWGINTYGHGEIYFPSGIYKFDSTIEIRTTVSLIGIGGGFFPNQQVQLRFDGNIRGFDIIQNNNGFGARSVTIKNMWLRNFGASTDSTADGIRSNTRVFFENVAVDNFGGNGFAIVTNDSGNANNSILMNCTGYYNAKSGLFLSGNESNNCGIYSSNFQANGMCGVLDNGFLGNMYYNCHTSSNGLRVASTYSKTWCRYNGQTYQAIKYPSHKGIEPTVTPGWQNYWVLNDAFHTVYPANWSSDSVYYVTGSYFVAGTASTSTFFGCYSESGQSLNMMNQFSWCVGGDHGAAFASKDNIYLNPAASQLQFKGGGFKVYDKDSSKTFTGLNNTFGFQVGSEKATHGNFQEKYFEASRTLIKFADNSTGNQAYSLIGKGFDPAKLGLTTLPRTGGVLYPYYQGFWVGNAVNGSQARNFSASTAVPTSGAHAVGDFVLYIGGDSTIIGYRCIVAGTPGQFKTLKAAN